MMFVWNKKVFGSLLLFGGIILYISSTRKPGKLKTQSPFRYSINPEYETEIISNVQLSIREELKTYDFSALDLKTSPDKALFFNEGGQPIRTLIITTWRSGSTFLGDILLSHPSTFYHYEPLLHYSIKRVRKNDPELASEALKTLKSLLLCNYDDLDNYLDYGQSHNFLFSHNNRFWKFCDKGKNPLCFDPQFLSNICSQFPFQTIKTVRLSLNLVETLLDDPDILRLKVILLIRDPRGTMESRKHRTFCPGNSDCENPANLCKDLVSDYHTAKYFMEKYPSRFRVIRYEDFSMDAMKNSKELLKFLKLSFHPQVEEFLDEHTKTNIGGVSSTYRDSKTAPYKWLTKLTYSEIKNIQTDCSTAMKLWGYNFINSASSLSTNFKTIRPFSMA